MAPPAVYRPGAMPVLPRPPAPPVYKPGAAPVQPRMAVQPAHQPSSRPGLARIATQPNRAPLPHGPKPLSGAHGVAQPASDRPAAPPAYRPNPPHAAWAIQPERHHAAAQGKLPPHPVAPSVARPQGAIQPYILLPPAKIYQNAPAKRPWFGYPYAVMGAAQLPAQERLLAVGGGDEYLTNAGGNAANVVNHAGGFSLRLSNDYQMAVEDSNLQARQPKTFFAAAAVVQDANHKLIQAGSRIRLAPGAQAITVLTGWRSQNRLVAVTPIFLDAANQINPDELPQNCNSVAGAVIGNDYGRTGNLSDKAKEIAAHFAPNSRRLYGNYYRDNTKTENDLNTVLDDLAQEYVTNQGDWGLWWQGANRYAKPNVGEAFVISTIGGGARQLNGQQRVRDYRTNTYRDLNWSYHFGGVVAKSGKDRITLENYARGDNRQDRADPRWYFQMYGEDAGQSYHEAFAATTDYANPLTVAINPNTQVRPLHRMG